MSSVSFKARTHTPPSVGDRASVEQLNLVEQLLVGPVTWDIEVVHDGDLFGWSATRAEARVRYEILVVIQSPETESVPRSIVWNIALIEERPPSEAHLRGVSLAFVVVAAASLLVMWLVFTALGGPGPIVAKTAFRALGALLLGGVFMVGTIIFAIPALVARFSPIARRGTEATARFWFLAGQVRGALRASTHFSNVTEQDVTEEEG